MRGTDSMDTTLAREGGEGRAAPEPLVAGSRASGILGLLALGLLLAGQAYGFTTAPERGMGHLQKIMYVHVPTAWSAFVAFALVFVASLVVLARRSNRADLLAASAAEVGVVLTGLTLVQGSIWARPTWGVWWTWEPRLTTTLILFLIFVGYLVLRSFTEDDGQRARWSAAVGILGFLNVPVVYMSVKWWRSIHQVQSTPSTVDPGYALGLRWNALAFLALTAFLVFSRYRIARIESRHEEILETRALEGDGS